jgi:hypothetical protein
MAAIGHTKSITIPDATGTVTNWNGATTATVAATNIVRPSDWNSAHGFTQTISGAAGNTFGTSTFAGSNLVYGFTNELYGSVSTEADAATLWFGEQTAGNYTAYTYQNRQLANSTTMQAFGGQNAVWLAPFRVGVPVSASTIMFAQSFSGTITSAATAGFYQTVQMGLYSQHTNPASSSRFDSWWSTQIGQTFWNSGTSSYSYSNHVTSGSSAGSNLGTASVMGMRLMSANVGSTLPAGLWIYAQKHSTATSGYSAAMSRSALMMDNPGSWPAGYIGSATNASIGYMDAGTWSVTTATLPASVDINAIRASNNLAPWFKIGAL